MSQCNKNLSIDKRVGINLLTYMNYKWISNYKKKMKKIKGKEGKTLII